MDPIDFAALLLFCIGNIKCDWCETNGALYVVFPDGEDWFLCPSDIKTRLLVIPNE